MFLKTANQEPFWARKDFADPAVTTTEELVFNQRNFQHNSVAWPEGLVFMPRSADSFLLTLKVAWSGITMATIAYENIQSCTNPQTTYFWPNQIFLSEYCFFTKVFARQCQIPSNGFTWIWPHEHDSELSLLEHVKNNPGSPMKEFQQW